jgi:hypothetical protein
VGRPVGRQNWLADLERSSGRSLQSAKRGRKEGTKNALSP